MDGGEVCRGTSKDHPYLLCGAGETPERYASRKVTLAQADYAGRMDSYVDRAPVAGRRYDPAGESSRSQQVTDTCLKAYGGFCTGSIGGPAAVLAQGIIQQVRGNILNMVAGRSGKGKEVEDFPAFYFWWMIKGQRFLPAKIHSSQCAALKLCRRPAGDGNMIRCLPENGAALIGLHGNVVMFSHSHEYCLCEQCHDT